MKAIPHSKRVLVYGDSITWGRIPNQLGRHDENTRWTCVLQHELGDRYEIIEEGLRARMLEGENPYAEDRNGLQQFGPILASHFPVDLLLIFLGTNDTNAKSKKSPEDIANGLRKYFSLLERWCQEFGMPMSKVLVVAPPAIVEVVPMFVGAGPKSRKLPQLYKALVKSMNAAFFDASVVVHPSHDDGVHLDAPNNILLGQALAPIISNILAPENASPAALI